MSYRARLEPFWGQISYLSNGSKKTWCPLLLWGQMKSKLRKHFINCKILVLITIVKRESRVAGNKIFSGNRDWKVSSSGWSKKKSFVPVSCPKNGKVRDFNSARPLLWAQFCFHPLFVTGWKLIACLSRDLWGLDAGNRQSLSILTCHSWRECGQRRRHTRRAGADLEASEKTQALCPEYNGFKDRMELVLIKGKEATSPECQN